MDLMQTVVRVLEEDPSHMLQDWTHLPSREAVESAQTDVTVEASMTPLQRSLWHTLRQLATMEISPAVVKREMLDVRGHAAVGAADHKLERLHASVLRCGPLTAVRNETRRCRWSPRTFGSASEASASSALTVIGDSARAPRSVMRSSALTATTRNHQPQRARDRT